MLEISRYRRRTSPSKVIGKFYRSFVFNCQTQRNLQSNALIHSKPNFSVLLNFYAHYLQMKASYKWLIDQNRVPGYVNVWFLVHISCISKFKGQVLQFCLESAHCQKPKCLYAKIQTFCCFNFKWRSAKTGIQTNLQQ